MGLDATVYCNCYETGKLREPPPDQDSIYVAADGSLECRSDDLEVLLAFDLWLRKRACEHKDSVWLHHHIGNVMLVSLLREELSTRANEFPVLLGKVIYNGTHAGDYLSQEHIKNAARELMPLSEFTTADGKRQLYVKNFYKQMRELVEAAVSVGKPISF
jgi:hypothetical protein